MTGAALGLVFRDASGRIVAALASRFRDLDLAEDSFADAGPERLDAVLSTIEIAYGRAHEDAAGSGPHFNYAAERLWLERQRGTLTE